MNLKWRDLLTPLSVITFLKAFLMAALPLLGLGSFANGVVQTSAPHITAWPTGPMLAAAFGAGFFNGLMMLSTLYTSPRPEPEPPGPSGFLPQKQG